MIVFYKTKDFYILKKELEERRFGLIKKGINICLNQMGRDSLPYASYGDPEYALGIVSASGDHIEAHINSLGFDFKFKYLGEEDGWEIFRVYSK